MEFGFDARTKELHAQLSTFMDEHIYPAEPVFETQVAAMDNP
jgi:acyl-CoA dehydrogenase